ncbi:MAG: WecB/TagA/CpsF family glycosyltransferase [Chromatiaceae bacterium]|nr:WecB/TagA/CpsF family glycosyltransferase [Chromatiaceae bacterium]
MTKPIDIPGPLGARGHRRRFSGLRRLLHALLLVAGEWVSRLLDLVIGLALLVGLAPLWAARALVSQFQAGTVLTRTPRLGRFRAPFELLGFAGRGPLRTLPVWLNILRGDMAIIGPRPLTPEEGEAVPVRDLARFSVRPGLLSPYRLRSRVGIAHEQESELDRDLVYGQSLRGDLGLAARSLVAVAMGGKAPAEAPPLLNFFGIPVINTTMAEAVGWIIDQAAAGERRTLAFVNPDCLNIAWHNETYKQFLLGADRVLPDGIGIHLGCRMLGTALRENVNGTDLFPRLCEAASQAGLSIYLLGARPGIAEAAANKMHERYPGLLIAGARDGYFSPEEEAGVVAEINASGAAILLVAFGVPRQELWIERWRTDLQPRVCLGVGGLFDFYSGRISRAPVWLREIGFEWVWRLLQEPKRMWRRYIIGNPLFLSRVWQQMRHPERFPLMVQGAAGEPTAPSTRSDRL